MVIYHGVLTAQEIHCGFDPSLTIHGVFMPHESLLIIHVPSLHTFVFMAQVEYFMGMYNLTHIVLSSNLCTYHYFDAHTLLIPLAYHIYANSGATSIFNVIIV